MVALKAHDVYADDRAGQRRDRHGQFLHRALGRQFIHHDQHHQRARRRPARLQRDRPAGDYRGRGRSKRNVRGCRFDIGAGRRHADDCPQRQRLCEFERGLHAEFRHGDGHQRHADELRHQLGRWLELFDDQSQRRPVHAYIHRGGTGKYHGRSDRPGRNLARRGFAADHGRPHDPTVAVTGNAADANATGTYTLNLGAATDPGYIVSQYTINWGDNQTSTPTTGGPITHIYGPQSQGPENITVSLTDPTGTFANPGSLAVMVNPPPTIVLSGAETPGDDRHAVQSHAGECDRSGIYGQPIHGALGRWIGEQSHHRRRDFAHLRQRHQCHDSGRSDRPDRHLSGRRAENGFRCRRPHDADAGAERQRQRQRHRRLHADDAGAR